MATKIKDQATAERAALKLNEGIEPAVASEPNAPKEKTTSEKLFPDFVTDDGGIVNRPIRSRVPEGPLTPLPATETPKSVDQGQTPTTQTPTAPIYISDADLKGKMVKLKVDGIEQDVPASELVKLTQLERHSNAQLMKIAQERAQLERDRADILARKPIDPIVKTETPVKKSAEVEALEARLAQMEQSMAQERALLMPQIQEAGIKRVEQMAKERLGTDDFRSYFDKIRESALTEAAKPENVSNAQARAYFDSDAFYFQKYQEMKLKDLVSKPNTPIPTVNSNAPVLQTQHGAPVIVNNQGQPVSVPSFESSSGVPSRESDGQSWNSTYQTLLARAKQSPSDENWMAVMRHKMRAGETV